MPFKKQQSVVTHFLPFIYVFTSILVIMPIFSTQIMIVKSNYLIRITLAVM